MPTTRKMLRPLRRLRRNADARIPCPRWQLQQRQNRPCLAQFLMNPGPSDTPKSCNWRRKLPSSPRPRLPKSAPKESQHRHHPSRRTDPASPKCTSTSPHSPCPPLLSRRRPRRRLRWPGSAPNGPPPLPHTPSPLAKPLPLSPHLLTRSPPAPRRLRPTSWICPSISAVDSDLARSMTTSLEGEGIRDR